MLKYYLGIFGGHGPNPAAAILCNNKLVAFGEEERFVRIKNATSILPIKSILFCLKSAGINANKLEYISIAWDCERYTKRQPKFLKALKNKYEWNDNKYNDLYESKLLTAFNPDYLLDNLRFALAKYNQFIDIRKIKFFNHHLCHAASSFYASGFNEALIFTLDGSGEENCSVVWKAKDNQIKQIETFKLPNTLGGFYGTFTEFLGFKSNSEEGKLMGLAPYGKFKKNIQNKLDNFIKYDSETGSYEIDPTYRFYERRTYNLYFTDKLVKMFGMPRLPNTEITNFHKDLAFNVQWRLEQVVSKLVERHVRSNKINNICLAGGVAMNCKMNGLLANSNNIKRIYVQPASSDNGTALGAACLSAIDNKQKINCVMPHAYWGPEYNDNEIEKAIKETKLEYCKLDNVINYTSLKLQQGKIIGWFNGRSEIGARSLGARSILANPMLKNMQLKLNSEVKHREDWRPFAPSIIEEEFKKYFGHDKPSEYMIIAYFIKKEYLKIFPSTIHVDGSVRPQSVKKNTNPKFHNLLREFGKLTGHPILINTSFNVQGEPIVESPQDALRCFSGTGIDVLVLGNFILEKKYAS